MALFRRNPVREAAERAYDRVVQQARRPEFFSRLNVPDSVDGRFELICLHAFLYLRRLKREGELAAPMGQRFFETMFTDFDRSLREMGTGDLSVGREVKRMAEGFYGRIDAYERGLVQGDAVLADALQRNLYGTTPITAAGCIAAMAAYVRDQAVRLDDQSAPALLAGEIDFGKPAELPARGEE